MHQYKFLFRLFNYSEGDIRLISIWSAISSFIISFCNDFLGISVGLFAMLFVIMIVDFITGLSASKYEEKNRAKSENREVKDVFSSRKGLGWVFKFGSYMTFLYISLLFSEYIERSNLEFMVWFIKLTHFYILIHIFYWEVKSVDENFERLGYSFQILKLMSNLFRKISSIAGNKIKENTETK